MKLSNDIIGILRYIMYVFVQAAIRLPNGIIGSVLSANHAVAVAIITYKLVSLHLTNKQPVRPSVCQRLCLLWYQYPGGLLTSFLEVGTLLSWSPWPVLCPLSWSLSSMLI
jgi:hypothetical protein